MMPGPQLTYVILIASALFVFTALGFAIYGVIKNPQLRKDGLALSQITIAIAQLFLLVTAFVATESLQISKKALSITESQKNVLMSLSLEYQRWLCTISGKDNDYDLALNARLDNKNSHHLRFFILEITPLYKNVKNGVIDDATNDNLPKLIFSQNNSNIFSFKGNAVEINANKIINALRTKYDGKAQIVRLASDNTYRLYGFYIGLSHWRMFGKLQPFSYSAIKLLGDFDGASKVTFNLRRSND